MIIRYISNPLDKTTEKQLDANYAPVPLKELVEGLDIDTEKHIAAVNGAAVEWDYIAASDDEIIVIADVKGAKGFFGGLMAAVGVVLCFTPAAALGPAFIAAGAGMLVGSLMTKKPSMPQTEIDSPTYNFRGIENSTGEGQVLPLVYGRHRVAGAVLEAYIDSFEGDTGPKQLLSATLGLSEGEIGGFVFTDKGKPDIYINDQPVDYFGNTVKYDFRTGQSEQPPLRAETKNERFFTVDQQCGRGSVCLYNVKNYNAYQYHISLLFENTMQTNVTVMGFINGNWIQLEFKPYNVKKGHADTLIIGSESEVKQLKITSSHTLCRVIVRSITECVNEGENFAQIRHYYAIQGVKLTRKSDYVYKLKNEEISALKVGIMLPGLYWVDGGGKNQKTSVLLRVYTSKDGTNWNAKYTEKLVEDNARSNLSVDINVKIEAGVQYIKLVRVTADSPDFQTANDTYLKSVTEIEDAEIQYNNTAVLGLKIEPTDRISGAMPNVSALIDGVKISSVTAIKESENYTKRTSSNPADIIYDLLTNKRYGLGRYLKEDQIDMNSLYEFAKWCDEEITYDVHDAVSNTKREVTEKRYELNLVIDSEMSAADALAMICKTTRSIVYWHGDKLRISMDRPSAPRQLFGMGSIVKESYKENYIGFSDIPNQVEARYLDETQSYKQQIVCAFDSTRTNEALFSKTVELFGVTKYSQVKRELIFALKKARAIRRFISFAVGIEGLVSEVGDIIYFSHDTPQYGYSGRVKSVEGNTVYFDREIETNKGTRYAVIFRDGNEVCRHEWVATASGCGSVALGEGCNILPGTTYALGAVKKEAIPLRIIGIKHTGKFTVELECEEYNESVYSLDESIVVDIPDYSSLGITDKHIIDGNSIIPMPDDLKAGMADVPSCVERVVLTEIVSERHGGGISVSVKVDWSDSELPLGSLSRIDYYAVLAGTEAGKWSVAGTAKSNTFTLNDVAVGESLKIAVKPYTMYGVTNNFYNIQEIAPTGKVRPADAPKILYVVQNGKHVTAKWEKVTNTIVSGYEIRVGNSWTFGRKIGSTKQACEFTSLAVSGGETTYLVAAVNADGERGEVSSYTINIHDADKNLVYDSDSQQEGWSGIRHNMTPVRNDLHLDGTSGSYTTGYIDLGEPVKSMVAIDYEVAGYVIAGTRWVDMDFAWGDERAGGVWAPRVDIDCVDHSHDISIFVQPPEDVHDIIRLSGATGSIKGVEPYAARTPVKPETDIRENVLKLVDMFPQSCDKVLHAQSTVTPAALETLTDSIIFLYGAGVKSIGNGIVVEYPWSHADIEAFRQAWQKYGALAKKIWQTTDEQFYFSDFHPSILVNRDENNLFICGAGSSHYGMDTSGKVWRCHRFAASRMEEYLIGHINDLSLKELCDKQEERRTYNKNDKCADCRYIIRCNTCYFSNLMLSGDMTTPPEHMCELAKIKTECFEKMHNELLAENNTLYLEAMDRTVLRSVGEDNYNALLQSLESGG